ncbi:hypothetical protein [Nocardiopsis rhodophaea]|uniref:hypothetical protein n=1 Tax=Nocardiopsis rhodophaea TaxID=280238 RepID=UPI0031DCF0F4
MRAWYSCTQYDQTQRRTAEAAVVRAAAEVTAPDDVREVLVTMARLDERHLWVSLCGLRDLAVDRSVDPGVSLRAAKHIAKLLDPLGRRVNGFAPLCGDFRF